MKENVHNKMKRRLRSHGLALMSDRVLSVVLYHCADLVLSIICSAGIFAARTSPIRPIPYSGKVADPTVNIYGIC